MKIGLHLRDKLLLGFSVLVLLALILGYIGILNLKEADNFSSQIVNNSLPRLKALYQIRDDVFELQTTTGRLRSMSDAILFEKSKKNLTELIYRIEQDKNVYETSSMNSPIDTKFSIEKLRQLHGHVSSLTQPLSNIQHRQIASYEIQEQIKQLELAEENLKDFVVLVIKNELTTVESGRMQSQHIMRKMYEFTLWFSVAIILFGLLLSLFLSRTFTRSIVHLREKTNAVMKGKKITDSSIVPLHISDEFDDLADHFLQMIHALREKEEKAHAISNALERHVSERTQALENSLSLFKALVDCTAEGILVVDFEGKILSYNHRFLEIWEFPQQMMKVGKIQNMASLLADQVGDIQQFMDRIQEIDQHPDQPSVDELKFRDGRIVERKSRPQKVGGKTMGRIWSFRDITDVKLLERKLKESNSCFLILGKVINDTVWDWDLQSNMILFSENIKKVYGYESKEMTYPLRWWQEKLHPDDRDRLLTNLHAMLKSDKVMWNAEFRFLCQDNSYVVVAGRAFILRDEEGLPYRVIGIME